MPFLRVSFKYIFCGRNLNLLCVSWFLVPWFSCFLVFLYLGFQIMYFSTSSSPLQTALTTAIRSWIKKSDQRKLRRCVSWKKYEFWSLFENLSWRDASTSKNSVNEFKVLFKKTDILMRDTGGWWGPMMADCPNKKGRLSWRPYWKAPVMIEKRKKPEGGREAKKVQQKRRSGGSLEKLREETE